MPMYRQQGVSPSLLVLIGVVKGDLTLNDSPSPQKWARKRLVPPRRGLFWESNLKLWSQDQYKALTRLRDYSSREKGPSVLTSPWQK